jgi:hypothetical protein
MKASCVIVALFCGLVVSTLVSCGDPKAPSSATNAQPHAAAAVSQRATDPNSLTFVPACDSAHGVLCFRDTAYVEAFPDEPPFTTKSWIWFGTAGDSVEVFAGAGTAMSTNFGQESFNGNTAPYFRHRLVTSGVLQTLVTMSDGRGDTVEYVFRIRRDGPIAPAALSATGQRARIDLPATRSSDRFAIIPLSVLPTVRDISAWQVDRGRYNVALVHDSLYQVCRLPCLNADTITLRPSSSVKWVGRRSK